MLGDQLAAFRFPRQLYGSEGVPVLANRTSDAKGWGMRETEMKSGTNESPHSAWVASKA